MEETNSLARSRRMGEMPEGKLLLSMAVPMMLSMLVQALYNIVDSVYVAKVSEDCLSALSLAFPAQNILIGLATGTGVGVSTMLSRALGSRDNKLANRVAGNSLFLCVCCWIVMAIFGIFFADAFIHSQTDIESIRSYGDSYLRIVTIGSVFVYFEINFERLLQSTGQTKLSMWAQIIGAVANIILDYIFIGLCHFGPAGAALGTTVSQAISVIVSLFVIVKRKTGISLKPSDFRPKRNVCGTILKIGIPIACQDGLIQIAFIIITIIANKRGLTDSAAVGIVEKVISFLFLVPSSMLSTVSALGAQNIGAGKPERAKLTLRYAIFITAGFGLIVAIIIQFIAEPVVGLFTTDNGVILAGGQYLRGYIWDCMFAGIHFSFSGYFCACQKSILSFIHNIIAISLVRVPGVYLTSKLFSNTLFPMGLATATGSLLSVIICVIAFLILTRKEKHIA